MKILVTGGTGVIGSHLVDAFISVGHAEHLGLLCAQMTAEVLAELFS